MLRRRLDGGPDTLAAEDAADLQAAYERGRRDERARRKRHPVAMTLMVCVAAAGALVLAVAAREGSFGRGGQVVDHNLAVAADRAEPMVRDAVTDAGAAVQDAGRNVRKSADAG
jgi:hypothetical protein